MSNLQKFCEILIYKEQIIRLTGDSMMFNIEYFIQNVLVRQSAKYLKMFVLQLKNTKAIFSHEFVTVCTTNFGKRQKFFIAKKSYKSPFS